MSLVTQRQVERLLIEASLVYIQKPTPEVREEVEQYAQQLLRLRGN